MKLQHLKYFKNTEKNEVFSGASALVAYKNYYYVVRDNSNSIYLFDSKLERIKEIEIFKGSLPNSSKERKEQKPDLEAATIVYGNERVPDKLILIPSGSKKNRMKGALLELQVSESNDLTYVDFSKLYDFLASKVGTVNIEGAIAREESILLFQRGNSRNSKNAIIYLKSDLNQQINHDIVFTEDHFEKIIYLELGKVDGIPYTFTDAILFNQNILFLAAAEQTEDAYLDGEVSSICAGVLDLNGAILWKEELKTDVKLEGLLLLSSQKNSDGQFEFLALSDADQDNTPSALYKLYLNISY